MIYYPHFAGLVISTLTEMGAISQEAVDAIEMIVAHESGGGRYLRQLNGPALGVIQMEPRTHDSIWDNCDTIKKYAAKLGIKRNVTSLVWDLRYNVFMARCMLLMDPRPLPTDLIKLSKYLKDYYNTAGGAAKVDSYYEALKRWQHG